MKPKITTVELLREAQKRAGINRIVLPEEYLRKTGQLIDGECVEIHETPARLALDHED